MTPSIALGLVFHQHQPVGNFDFVFEELFEKSYEPLLACLERHPAIKVGMHFSGPLIDWLAGHQAGYLARLRDVVTAGQVEVLGGAYYEPILPAIIEEDRIGQLAKMREDIAQRFDTAPSGAWLAERVWEPGLPTSLEAAGYRWTIVDDVHFVATGMRPEDVDGWYLTEAEGRAIGVFGSSTQMRYIIPWAPVDECIEFLRARATLHPGSLVTMGDDGEKFGGWPTTYKLCWEDGWVDTFMDRLERESSWIETVHLGEWQQRHEAEGLIYLPSASYMEMGAWSLPPGEQQALKRAQEVLREGGEEELQRLLRGGHWRNFLIRYPEVNMLQKRAMELSRQARDAKNAPALDHVWKAECNCPYWHGVFGGVYLENIRHANFGHIAAADNAVWPGIHAPEIRDWDFDGHDEAGLRSNDHLALVAPSRGGEIAQWDLRQAGWNLTHAVAIRPEAYHNEAREEAGGIRKIRDESDVKDPRVLTHKLRYDRGMRVAAQDTLLPPGSGREAYAEERLLHPATASRWSAEGQEALLSCVCEGAAYEKRITVGEDLEVTYESTDDLRLFSEWNLSLPGEPEFSIEDGILRITTTEFSLEALHNAEDVWSEQILSVSNTEGGLELAPQGWCIVFATELGPNQEPFALRWRQTLPAAAPAA